MGWPLSTALTAEMQRAYGWAGALLWAHDLPPWGPVAWQLWHVSLVLGGAAATLLLVFEAGVGRGPGALWRLVLGVVGVLASHTVVGWLWQLNEAALSQIAAGVAAHAIPPPGLYGNLIELLVFGVPYLLLVLALALMLIVRLAAVAVFVAVAPLPWLLYTHPRFGRLPWLWLYELCAWTLLPAAEGFLLAAVRGLGGQLSLAVPASDMLLALVVMVLMLRLPFVLLRGGSRWVAR